VLDVGRSAWIRPSKTFIGEINSIQTDVFNRINRKRDIIIIIINSSRISIIIIIRYGFNNWIRRNRRQDRRDDIRRNERRARTNRIDCSP